MEREGRGERMAKVVAGMTISADGFIAERNGDVWPLYKDLAGPRGAEYLNEMIEETGAALMGRRTFEMADDPDDYVGNYELQVPIFVVTHHPPEVAPKQDENLTFTFVTDGIVSAVAKATAAARDRVVTVVGGPSMIRQLLDAGLMDELRIDVVPVLLGDGVRMFDDLASANGHLKKREVVEAGERTSLRFSVG
jgi:dihydrofolate reductase